MEERLLRKILEVQIEMLEELRLLRKTLAARPAVTAAPATPQPTVKTPPVARPAVSPKPAPSVTQTAAVPKPASRPAVPPVQAAVATPEKPVEPAATAEPQPPATASTAPSPEPAQTTQPAPQALAGPQRQPPPAESPTQPAGAMLTVNELTDLGGQFLEPGQMARGKVKPVEASDLLRDIKAKNRAKSSAFADFENFGRNR